MEYVINAIIILYLIVCVMGVFLFLFGREG